MTFMSLNGWEYNKKNSILRYMFNMWMFTLTTYTQFLKTWEAHVFRCLLESFFFTEIQLNFVSKTRWWHILKYFLSCLLQKMLARPCCRLLSSEAVISCQTHWSSWAGITCTTSVSLLPHETQYFLQGVMKIYWSNDRIGHHSLLSIFLDIKTKIATDGPYPYSVAEPGALCT